MIDELKKAFMHSHTGGVSGKPNRYHGPGSFHNFKFADLFDNNKWTREQLIDPHTGELMFKRNGEPLYTSYYVGNREASGGEPSVIADAAPVDPAPVDPGLNIDVSAGRLPINSRTIPRGRSRPPMRPPSMRPRFPRIQGVGRTRPPMLTPSQRQAIPRVQGVGRTRPPMLTPSQRQAIPRIQGAGRTRPVLTPPSQRQSIPRLQGAGRTRPALTPPSQRPVIPQVNIANQSAKNLLLDILDAGKWLARTPLGFLGTGLLHSPDVGANSDSVPQGWGYFDSMDESYKPPTGLGPNAKRVTTETPDGKRKVVTTEEIDPIADQHIMGMETASQFNYVPETGEMPVQTDQYGNLYDYSMTDAQRDAVNEMRRAQQFEQAENYDDSDSPISEYLKNLLGWWN